jgi:FtsP/CotA-like multicopper oxidase with cupredoxin domain
MRLRKTKRFGVVGVALLGLCLGTFGCSDDIEAKAGPTPARDLLKPFPLTGKTKSFDLVVAETEWEVGVGAIFNALTYNGKMPGPVIEVNAGDKVVLRVTNKTSASRSVHTHISEFDQANDGSGESVAKPGETRTFTWDALYAGTFPYHDHGDDTEGGIARGLAGAVVVHAPDEEPANEHIVVLQDLDTSFYKQLPGVADPKTGVISEEGTYRGGHQYMHVFNGKAYMDGIPPFKGKVGERQRWRIVSIGKEFHTFHIHGNRWISQGELTDNIQLGPGMYSTFEFIAEAPGHWMVHCHVPDHMEGGMMASFLVAK